MQHFQALKDQRVAKAAAINAMLRPDAYSESLGRAIDPALDEIKLLDSQIARTERMMEFDARLESRSGSYSDNCVEFGLPAHDKAVRRAFANALRYGAENLPAAERKFLRVADIQNVAEGTGAGGGFMVPTVIQRQLVQRLKAFGGMRKVSQVITTNSGVPISWATLDDTSNIGELVAENVVASNSDLVFGNVTFNGFKFSSKIVPVSVEILRDVFVDIERIIVDTLAARIGKAQNSFFTGGNGTGAPLGVVNSAELGIQLPTGNTTSLTENGIVDLYHSLDRVYREKPTCAWMMHDLTFKEIKKLKDANSRPLWIGPGEDGIFAPDNQFGSMFDKPIIINNDMPLMAANAKSVLFGDFSNYLIRDVDDATVFRFTDSPYASHGQVGFLAWIRGDGRLLIPAAIKYLQNSAS